VRLECSPGTDWELNSVVLTRERNVVIVVVVVVVVVAIVLIAIIAVAARTCLDVVSTGRL